MARAMFVAGRCARVLVIIAGLLVGHAHAAVADSVTPSSAVGRYVSVRASPSATASIVGQLQKDEKALLVGSTRLWRRIELPDGVMGYVSRRWTVVLIEPPGGRGNLVVTFIDVNEGDAILLQVGTVAVLVDTGKALAWSRGLGTVLDTIEGPLDAIIVTHPHVDHYGGAAEVLAHLTVQAVFSNGERRGPPRDPDVMPTWKAFEDAVARERLRIGALAIGEVLTPAHGLTIEVLSGGDPQGGQFRDSSAGMDINNDSLVLMVEYAGRRLLLTGDIEGAAGTRLVERHCTDGEPQSCPRLRADVLKVPHHGSASFAPAFFAAVHPSWAVISAGYASTAHCLPRTEPIEALRREGARLISTSADGRENAVLTISATGRMSWTMPAKGAFAWRKTAESSARCGTRVEYTQGR